MSAAAVSRSCSHCLLNENTARERATPFAQGVTPVRFLRGMIDEALIVGLLATAVGAAPLLTLPRLRRTVIPATLRVVE